MRDPRHILITGASSGLGAALALHYAGPGVRLCLHGRNAQRLEQIAEQVRSRGAVVATYIGDVADAGDMAQWIAACDATDGIDLVIANAGISRGGLGGSENADQVNAVLGANVMGVYNTVLPVLPLMEKRGRGQIAIMSSMASFRGFAGSATYCASKAAVRIYGEALRAEMAPLGVEVNVICPGFVATPMTAVNRFRMPFLMNADKAAHIICQGLIRNRARIAFPWPIYLLMRVLTALPQPLMDFIARRMPKK